MERQASTMSKNGRNNSSASIGGGATSHPRRSSDTDLEKTQFIVVGVPLGHKLILRPLETPLDSRDDIEVILLYLEVPQLGSASGGTGPTTDPYAFEAREVLRRQALGEAVHIHHPKTVGRFVAAHVSTRNGALSAVLVKRGLAKVHETASKARDDSYAHELLEMDELAKRKGSGMHNTMSRPSDANVCCLPPLSNADFSVLASHLKGSRVKISIESLAQSGVSGEALLTSSLQPIEVRLSGIKAVVKPESRAHPLMAHMQRHALHRTLTATVDGWIDGRDTGGSSGQHCLSITPFVEGEPLQWRLVRAGVATIDRDTARLLPSADVLPLYRLRLEAQMAQAGQWSDWKPSHHDMFFGTVVAVPEGFRIVVQLAPEFLAPGADPQVEVDLLCVKQFQEPRDLRDDSQRKKNSSGYEEEVWDHGAFACREYVRQRLIRRNVRVLPLRSSDYAVAWVWLAESDDTDATVNEKVLLSGLASYRSDDNISPFNPLSPEARKAFVDKKREPKTTIRVFKRPSRNVRPSEAFRQFVASELGFGREVRAVCERMASLRDIEVYLPDHNARLEISLPCIDAFEDEPTASGFYADSLAATKRRILHQNILVVIICFDGQLYGDVMFDSRSLALSLVGDGRVVVRHVFQFGPEFPMIDPLLMAHRQAVEDGVGIWHPDRADMREIMVRRRATATHVEIPPEITDIRLCTLEPTNNGSKDAFHVVAMPKEKAFVEQVLRVAYDNFMKQKGHGAQGFHPTAGDPVGYAVEDADGDMVFHRAIVLGEPGRPQRGKGRNHTHADADAQVLIELPDEFGQRRTVPRQALFSDAAMQDLVCIPALRCEGHLAFIVSCGTKRNDDGDADPVTVAQMLEPCYGHPVRVRMEYLRQQHPHFTVWPSFELDRTLNELVVEMRPDAFAVAREVAQFTRFVQPVQHLLLLRSDALLARHAAASKQNGLP